MKFTMYQVISFLNKIENSDRKFKRVNDEKFKLFKGIYGDLMIELNETYRPCPIFLYMQDEWILEE
jgi:hypothetical protein